MALQGAEVLLYPTAIGSEPEAAGADGHEPDVAARDDRPRRGQRLLPRAPPTASAPSAWKGSSRAFYGRSFIADYTGEMIAEADRTEETVLVAPLDLDDARSFRAGHGILQGPSARPVRAAADVRR